MLPVRPPVQIALWDERQIVLKQTAIYAPQVNTHKEEQAVQKYVHPAPLTRSQQVQGQVHVPRATEESIPNLGHVLLVRQERMGQVARVRVRHVRRASIRVNQGSLNAKCVTDGLE